MSMPWIFRHPILRLLLALLGIWAFAFGLTIPFLTLTARDRGVSVDAIGVIAASFLLTQIVFQVPLGALSDRVGRSVPLAAGIALFSVATVGFTQADSATAFVILRAVQGVAFALGLPAYRALVADVTAPDQRGRAYATLGMAYSGGLLLGPAIGGILVNLVGRNALFLVTAAMEAALAAGVLVFLRGAGRPGRRTEAADRVPLAALFVRPLIGAFLLAFAGHIQFGFFESIWGLYVPTAAGTISWSGSPLARSPSRIWCWPRSEGDWPTAATTHAGCWSDFSVWRRSWPAMGWCRGSRDPGPRTLSRAPLPRSPSRRSTPTSPRRPIRDPRAHPRDVRSSMMAGAATSALGGSILYRVAPGLPFVIGGAALAMVTIVAVGLIRSSGQAARSVSFPAGAPRRRMSPPELALLASVRRHAVERTNDDDLPQPVSRCRDSGDAAHHLRPAPCRPAGDKPALIDGPTGRTVTFGQFAERCAAQRRAGGPWLPQGGCLRRSSPPTRWSIAIAFHAIASIGGIAAPINPTYTVAEIERHLRDIGAAACSPRPSYSTGPGSLRAAPTSARSSSSARRPVRRPSPHCWKATDRHRTSRSIRTKTWSPSSARAARQGYRRVSSSPTTSSSPAPANSRRWGDR